MRCIMPNWNKAPREYDEELCLNQVSICICNVYRVEAAPVLPGEVYCVCVCVCVCVCACVCVCVCV